MQGSEEGPVDATEVKDSLQTSPGPAPGEPETQARPSPRAGGTARTRAAWVVAVLVDAIQLATAPTELAGPLEWAIGTGADLVTAVVMMVLLGFHWAFLPSFITKLLPMVDLAPTWTAAVFFVTRAQRKSAAPREVR
jgi:hypothetical protein